MWHRCGIAVKYQLCRSTALFARKAPEPVVLRVVERWSLPTLPTVRDADALDRFAFALRWAMWQRDVTPPQLAKAVGKGPDAVRRWKDGEGAPSALDVGRLAEALGVRVDYFTSPPELPPYPFEEYEVSPAGSLPRVEKGLEAGVEEGVRRRREHRGDPTPPGPAQSRRRPPRDNGEAP